MLSVHAVPLRRCLYSNHVVVQAFRVRKCKLWHCGNVTKCGCVVFKITFTSCSQNTMKKRTRSFITRKIALDESLEGKRCNRNQMRSLIYHYLCWKAGTSRRESFTASISGSTSLTEAKCDSLCSCFASDHSKSHQIEGSELI